MINGHDGLETQADVKVNDAKVQKSRWADKL